MTRKIGLGVIYFVTMFVFPTMCLAHVMLGTAGPLTIPLLMIAFSSMIVAQAQLMSCCAKGGNTK